MAMVDTAPRPHDRHSRRQPFTKWMKRLASLKNPAGPTGSSSKRNQLSSHSKHDKSDKNDRANTTKNNPYPVSGKPNSEPSAASGGHGHLSFYTPPSGRSVSYASPSQSKTSIPVSQDGQQPPTIGSRSVAPTVSTNPETINSDGAQSKAGTTATAGAALSTTGVGGGDGSTFTSRSQSLRSLTTTLTTVQSAATSNLLAAPNNAGPTGPLAALTSHHTHQNSASQFTHQFPSSPAAASAIPSHVTSLHNGGGHPATYNTATANNVLTDNASILTLASSSKRRRRNSYDTNASVRALAPSSLFGGSRESLPLSVLSANVNDQSSITGGHAARQVSIGLPRDERASVYSGGIAPAGERSSYYATKKSNPGEDGGSVRSGLISHGRTDSITKSIGGGLGSNDSPLASPGAPPSASVTQQQQHGSGRRHSGWGEVNEKEVGGEENDQESMAKTAAE